MNARPRPRVCMIVHAEYPQDPRVSREALAARDAGHSVSVVCLRAAREPARETVAGVDVVRLGVPVTDRGEGALAGLLVEYVGFALRASLHIARRLFARPRLDVVYINTPPDFLAVVGILPKLLGRQVVVDIHDRSPLMFGARYEGRAARIGERALETVERMACALADDVVTVHEPYVRELEHNSVPRSKIAIVMNSPDPQRVERVKRASDAGGADDRTGPGGKNEFVVAYHGTIDPWYGVPLLVDALAEAAELGDWRAIILGDGDALPDTRARAEQLGVSGRIEFSGRFLPLDEALAKVARSSCGVVPNLPSALNRLTLSTKLLEYVALGVPAVVARLETLADHFSDDEVTFFEPGDPRSLADALRWVAHNPEDAALKSERALRRMSRYEWATSRDSLLAVLGGERT